jgi:hypothetical protein
MQEKTLSNQEETESAKKSDITPQSASKNPL